MRVALYARVSTRDKDQTPETQLHHLRAYVSQREWTVIWEYVDTASAADLRGRSAWRALLADAERRRFDLILVTKIDRAFRSVQDAYDVFQRLEIQDISIKATTQDWDTSTSTGKLALHMLMAFAEFERDLIKERIREGLDRARAEGKHLGRPKGSTDGKKRRTSGYFRRYANNRG